MLQDLTKSMFAQSLNSAFRIRLEDDAIVHVKQIDLREWHYNPRQEQFAVLFQGPFNKHLGKGHYNFDHDTMGQFDLFIIPVGMDQDGFLYGAVFNRRTEPNSSCL